MNGNHHRGPVRRRSFAFVTTIQHAWLVALAVVTVWTVASGRLRELLAESQRLPDAVAWFAATTTQPAEECDELYAGGIPPVGPARPRRYATPTSSLEPRHETCNENAPLTPLGARRNRGFTVPQLRSGRIMSHGTRERRNLQHELGSGRIFP